MNAKKIALCLLMLWSADYAFADRLAGYLIADKSLNPFEIRAMVFLNQDKEPASQRQSQSL
jgi:hypothetical protein